MAISHHLRLYPNLPLGLGKEFYRPPSLAAILKLDTSLALKEKFHIREFTLGIRQEDACPVDADGSLSPSAETPLGTGSESLPLELQVHRMMETVPTAGGNQGNGALQEVGDMSHACVKNEQAEDGEAGEQSGGALDLLLLASAGVETEKGHEDDKRQGTCCPVCDIFSTDSAMVLSAHIVECLSESKNQKVKGKKKMRSIVDVIAADSKSDTPAPLASRSPPTPAPASPETNDRVVKVTESLSHAEREMPQESSSQVTEAVKRSFRKRVARKSADFIMEPLKKRRKRRESIPYKGIKQRTSGRWAAEISDSAKKIRLWLGTFDTPEEAALAYDRAAIKIRGAAAQTNILSPEGAADNDEPPSSVAANDEDGREEISAVEGITVVRSRKGRRKQKPEKLPLKELQAPRGGQSETPRSDGSTEGTTPMTPQGDHNVNRATPEILHGDQNMNRELTPVMHHCSDQAMKTATPVIQHCSDEDIKTATPVIQYCSDQDMKMATPVIHHCSDQDMKMATPVIHHSSDQDMKMATPVIHHSSDQDTKTATPVIHHSSDQDTKTATPVILHPSDQGMKTATPETPAGDQKGRVATPPELEVPVPLKIIDPHQAASCEEDIVVVSGRLGKGRPPKVKREGFSTLVPNRRVARTRRPTRKMEEAWEANNEAGKAVIGSTLLEILD